MKALIFDLNGILILSPKLSDRFRDEFKVSENEFLDALKKIMEEVRKPDAGECFGYWKPYFDKWNIGLSKEEFYKYWFGAEKENIELINFLRDLKIKNPKLQMFILSNNFKERADYYRNNFPFLDELFDKIYYSWETGILKPSKEAFLNLLNENNLEPNDCLYFDDGKKNIEIADELGLKAYLYNGNKNLIEILRNFF